MLSNCGEFGTRTAGAGADLYSTWPVNGLKIPAPPL